MYRTAALSSLVIPLAFSLSGLHADVSAALDLHHAFPFQAPLSVKLGEKENAALGNYSALYPLRSVRPNGKGVPADELAKALAAIRTTFALDPAQPGTGRKILIDAETHKPEAAPAAAGINSDLLPACASLSKLYARCDAKQASEVESTYRSLMALWLSQAPRPGDKIAWIGNGYTWRSLGHAMFGMLHLLPADDRDRALVSLILISGGNSLFQEKPHSSTDDHLNLYGPLLTAIAALEDPRLKWQYVVAVRRGIDVSLLEQPLVTPDGGIIHHAGHHIAYGSYSFASVIGNITNLTRAGITSDVSKEVVERLKLVPATWAWTTLAGQSPQVFNLRPGPVWSTDQVPGDAPGRTIDFAVRIAQLDGLMRNDADLAKCTDMARIAGSKTYGHADRVPEAWRGLMNSATMQPLTGHRPFPVMGAAIHRRDDWTAVVRGANTYWRGAEVYAGPEHPGAYLDEIMQGALFIFSTGKDGAPPNTVDSGYASEGYNPNLFPNASSVQMDNVARAGRGNPDYMGSGAKQGGGVDLDGNGMWAWNPSHCRKSAFFFGNRITLVTRELKLKGPVATGVIQTRLADPSTSPLRLDGEVRSADGDWTLPGETAHTLLDDKGTGYFLPAGNPSLKVHRGLQEWTYVRPQSLKPGLDPKAQPPLKNRKDLAAALPNYQPTQGAFSTAWFDHGETPQGAACTFTVLVKTTAEELEHFANDMKGDKPPFKLVTNESVHDFLDSATGTRCVATFTDNASFEPDGVTAINRPSTLMWRRDGQKLALSCGSTDLKDLRPFVIKLAGIWQADSPLPKDAKLTQLAGNSQLEIPYRDQTPVKIALKQNAKARKSPR